MIKKILRWLWTRRVISQCGSCVGPIRANRKADVTANTSLGSNVNFNGIKILGRGKVIIGDNFHSGPECLIMTENHNYEGESIPYDSTYIIEDVIIEDNVWLGRRVMILGGVRIGEGAIVQAGSVVVSDVPPLSIVGGHPAKIFKKRDEVHYIKMKKEKKFL